MKSKLAVVLIALTVFVAVGVGLVVMRGESSATAGKKQFDAKSFPEMKWSGRGQPYYPVRTPRPFLPAGYIPVKDVKDVKLTAKLQGKGTIDAGVPINLSVRLSNQGTQWIYYTIFSPNDMFLVEVKGEDGKNVPLTKWGAREIPLFALNDMPVEPGSYASFTIPLSRLFDLTLAGKYTVRVAQFLRQPQGYVEATPITVKVSEPHMSNVDVRSRR